MCCGTNEMTAGGPPAPGTSTNSIIFLLQPDFLTSVLRIKDNAQLNKKLFFPAKFLG